MAITEFTVSSSNTNKWASIPKSSTVVGGSTKYGIYVNNTSSPRYTFLNDTNFFPDAKAGSVAIVELYANSDGNTGGGDPNNKIATVFDGVALTNVAAASIPYGALSKNTAVYGVNPNTKQANYVYNFTNNGYADTKIMGIGGNKKRRVFAIRS